MAGEGVSPAPTQDGVEHTTIEVDSEEDMEAEAEVTITFASVVRTHHVLPPCMLTILSIWKILEPLRWQNLPKMRTNNKTIADSLITTRPPTRDGLATQTASGGPMKTTFRTVSGQAVGTGAAVIAEEVAEVEVTNHSTRELPPTGARINTAGIMVVKVAQITTVVVVVVVVEAVEALEAVEAVEEGRDTGQDPTRTKRTITGLVGATLVTVRTFEEGAIKGRSLDR